MLDEVARRFYDAGRLLRVAMPCASSGHLRIMMAQPEEGLARTGEALELERTLGHPEGEAYCLWLRSEALAALGRGEEARRSAETSLSIARRLGHREWTAAALKGLGAACLAIGDIIGSETAFRGCLDTVERLPIFSSWAAAGLASVLMVRGDPAGAGPYVARALRDGTPITHYDARLVEAEIAIALDDPAAPRLVEEALKLAESGGHLQSAGRLRALLASSAAFPAPGTRTWPSSPGGRHRDVSRES